MAEPNANKPPGRRRQFSLGGLMMLTMVMAVMAAVLGGLLNEGARRQNFVLIGIAAPIGVMVLASLWYHVTHWRK